MLESTKAIQPITNRARWGPMYSYNDWTADKGPVFTIEWYFAKVKAKAWIWMYESLPTHECRYIHRGLYRSA